MQKSSNVERVYRCVQWGKKTIQRATRSSGQNMWQRTVCPQNNKQALVVCSLWNLSTHFILYLTLLSAALPAIGSTLGAATGLFRAGGMSTLHSLSEWRLTTCGALPPSPPHPIHQHSPSGPVFSTVWDPRTATRWGARQVHRCVIKIFPCSCAYGDTTSFFFFSIFLFFLMALQNPALLPLLLLWSFYFCQHVYNTKKKGMWHFLKHFEQLCFCPALSQSSLKVF